MKKRNSKHEIRNPKQYQINKFQPSEEFATQYVENAKKFLNQVRAFRESSVGALK